MPLHAASFFKILVHSKFQEELMIPKSFIEEYWNRLSNPIVLKLPNSVEQKVYWTKREDNIWLEKGWERVVELCCLKYEYLLIFKYKGGSCFKVKVYDKSASQIYYSSLRCNEEATKDCEVEVGDDDHSIERANERPAHLCKRKKTNTADQQNDGKPEISRAQNMERDNGQLGKRKRNEGISRIFPRSDDHDVLEESQSQNMEANQIVIHIKEYHLGKGTSAYIPTEFIKRHSRCRGKNVLLQVEKTSWTVKVLYRGLFGKGWPEFASGCKLGVGDLCLFKLIDEQDFVFKVSISRKHQ